MNPTPVRRCTPPAETWSGRLHFLCFPRSASSSLRHFAARGCSRAATVPWHRAGIPPRLSPSPHARLEDFQGDFAADRHNLAMAYQADNKLDLALIGAGLVHERGPLAAWALEDGEENR